MFGQVLPCQGQRGFLRFACILNPRVVKGLGCCQASLSISRQQLPDQVSCTALTGISQHNPHETLIPNSLGPLYRDIRDMCVGAIQTFHHRQDQTSRQS